MQTAEKKVRELESQLGSTKERLSSLRKLNTQYESKMRTPQPNEEDEKQAEVQGLRDRCLQMEMDNRELSKHLKILLENTQKEVGQLEYYKNNINDLEV